MKKSSNAAQQTPPVTESKLPISLHLEIVLLKPENTKQCRECFELLCLQWEQTWIGPGTFKGIQSTSNTASERSSYYTNENVHTSNWTKHQTQESKHVHTCLYRMKQLHNTAVCYVKSLTNNILPRGRKKNTLYLPSWWPASWTVSACCKYSSKTYLSYSSPSRYTGPCRHCLYLAQRSCDAVHSWRHQDLEAPFGAECWNSGIPGFLPLCSCCAQLWGVL